MMTVGRVSCRNYGPSHKWLALHTFLCLKRDNVIIDRFYSLFFLSSSIWAIGLEGLMNAGGLGHNWLIPFPLKNDMIDCFSIHSFLHLTAGLFVPCAGGFILSSYNFWLAMSMTRGQGALGLF